MAQLRQDYPEFVERGAEVIVIGPEDAEKFGHWWHEHGMPFIGLADPDHRVAKRYGQQVNLLKLGRMPAVVIIDKNGAVRFTHYGNSMSDIPLDDDLLDRLDELSG